MDNNPNNNIEIETLDGVESVPTVEQPVTQNVSVEQPVVQENTQSIQEQVSEQPVVSNKKKINPTLVVVLIAVGVLGLVVILLSFGGKGGTNKYPDEVEETKIKVSTGTDWGNKYLTYMLTNKPDLETYEISFLDVDDNGTPEMFLKYIDNTGIDSLKILYIEDEDVYETKYYHDYRIRYIYSLKDKTTNWYLFMTTTKHYGTYTMISKIIDKMAFDSDIKASNDQELIQYGRSYYDTDYQLVFYNIKKDNHENDYKNFISKYDSNVEKMNKVKTKVEDKYKEYEYIEDVPEVKDSVGLSGRLYKFGNYYAHVLADELLNIPEHTEVIVLNDDGTIIVRGTLYNYTVSGNSNMLHLSDEFGNSFSIALKASNVFSFEGYDFIYK